MPQMMKKLFSLQLTLWVALLAGCTPAPALTPEFSTSAPPGSMDTLPLEATITPLPPVPETRKIVFADNGQTVTLKTGDRFTLELEAGYTWTITITDMSVLHLIEDQVKSEDGIYTGLLEALQPGQVQLIAGGDPVCRQSDPPCGMPALLFQITVRVE